MIGKRVEPVLVEEHGSFEPLNPGEYGLAYDRWVACAPNGTPVKLDLHRVTEHEDGTITAVPFILVSTRVNGFRETLYHGYLELGVWRESPAWVK